MYDLAAAVPALGLAAGGTWWVLDLPATFLAIVAILYAALAVLLLFALPPELPGPGLGPANRITLLRALFVITLAALPLSTSALGIDGRWWVVVVGTVVMVMDGFDGWVARRTKTETGFGARFDMETDALLMLVLSGLVWVEERAGAWVLLIGAMRYLFVGVSSVVPALRAPLFPSLRRKGVCVVQAAGLLICLGPIIPADMALAVAIVALASLVWSFGVDTVWLLRQRPAASTSGP